MKDALLPLFQLALRIAMVAAINRNGNLQLLIKLFEAMGLRQWLVLLAAPIIGWGGQSNGQMRTASASMSKRQALPGGGST
jgi:hypothetical protein